MTEHNEKKRAESVAYLKERGKYLLDNSSFVPTPSHLTEERKDLEGTQSRVAYSSSLYYIIQYRYRPFWIH